jgi:hypothetical protein
VTFPPEIPVSLLFDFEVTKFPSLDSGVLAWLATVRKAAGTVPKFGEQQYSAGK